MSDKTMDDVRNTTQHPAPAPHPAPHPSSLFELGAGRARPGGARRARQRCQRARKALAGAGKKRGTGGEGKDWGQGKPLGSERDRDHAAAPAAQVPRRKPP